jgi:hypothetical protein
MFFEKKKEIMLAIGMFSLTVAVLLNRFAEAGTMVDFLCGLFTGLSMTMNLGYLIKFRLEKNSKFNQK